MKPCASTDEELKELYASCMEPDFKYWRERVARDGFLNKTHIDAFLDGIIDGENLQSLVLIRRGKWYYPFHKEWNWTQRYPDRKEGMISLWVAASQYWFEKFGDEMDFPDTFFFLSDQDMGWCSGYCPMPALSITRNTAQQTTDLLYPFMVEAHHSLYNYPWQLKDERAFFVGRPNWKAGVSSKTFPDASGTPVTYFSRKHMSALSRAHPDELYAALLVWPDELAAWGANHTVLNLQDLRSIVPIHDHARWKYLLHLDGVTYSFRLGRIMHTNSVILKEETSWPEYYVRALKPGVHYLPIFKDGPDDVLKVTKEWGNRTNELKRIAWNSQSFAQQYLCPKARMVYFRRLLQEYKALFGPPRNNAMQGFIDDVLWPLIQKKMAGDVNATYNGIPPFWGKPWSKPLRPPPPAAGSG